jgi:hypothetical protein
MSVKLLAVLAACLVGMAAWSAGKDEEPPEVRYAAMLEREYGPLGTTTEQILGREATHEPVTIVGALVYRLRAKPLERLSLVEKKLLAVYGLKEEVDNGGFTQYFNGPMGDGAALALQALREMQAAPLVKSVQKALAVFPGATAPADPVKRAKLIESVKRRATTVWPVCDDEFYLREDDLAPLAFAYAKRNRAHITLP